MVFHVKATVLSNYGLLFFINWFTDFFTENLGTEVLSAAEMAAQMRLRERDQSTQRFHVGCDNRCLLGNEFGGLHGREFLGRTSMILILTNQAVFVTLSVVKIPPLAQPSLF